MAHRSILTIFAGILAGTALIVSGCSSTQDFGDRMSSVSKEWKQAEDKADKGEKLVKDGKSDIRKGEDMQDDGARAERKATRMLADAQAHYDLVLASVGLATNSETAEAEAKVIQALEKDIKSSTDDLNDAKAKETRGLNRMRDGRSKVEKGERLIAEGRTEMKVIEADYRMLAASTN